jgi:type I restriction enzyme S subunit
MNYIPRERFNLLGNGKIRKNDILFCLRGSLGKFASVGELSEGAIASSLVIVRPKDSVIDAFVSLYFQSDLCASMIDKYKNGAAQPNLSAGSLKNFIIPVPPFPEQHRIIGILDEAFEGIAIAKANAEKNLHNARVLFESHLQAVFAVAWETGELTTLADLATDITDGDHMPPPKASSGVPFITIGNVAKDTRTIDFSDTFMVSREYFDRLKNNKKPMKGDVLYTVTGSFGIPVLISEHREFCFQRHIGLVRPKSDVCSEWLYYLLMSPQVFKQATDGATGTAQKTVSLKLLRGFQVPIVPMERQQSTVTKLNALTEETQRLASIYQQKLAALDALKKSLLDQAFRGEL